MSSNNQPLSGNTITPIQRVSLNSLITNLVLDADSGNSSLVVKTGAITSLYIDKYANVGINTTSPGAQFEVSSNNGSCLRLKYGSSSTAFANVFMTSDGNLPINPNTTGSEIVSASSLNLSNHNGTTVGLKLNGTLVAASAAQLNYNVVVPGTAAAVRAMVLDSSSSITGINSLTSTNIHGTIQTASQPNITSLGTLSSLVVSGNLTVSGSFNLSGGGSVGDSLAYLNNITVGTASALKALVVDSNKDITGIRSVGLTTINVGGSVVNGTEAGYLSGVTAGSALNSKALVLSSSGVITGIGSLSATSLSGTIQTAAQPNITSLGSLSSLLVSGATTINSTTNTTSSTNGGALTVGGGLGVAKSAYVGLDLIVGGNLVVNGTSTTVNSTSISIQDNTLVLNASPSGANDSGIIINRYQTVNDSTTGSVVSDTPTLTTVITSSSSTTVSLLAGSGLNNYYQGWWIKAGTQIRKVQSYVASTKTITIEASFTTVPSNGSTVALYNRSYATFVWNETAKCFNAGFAATDSSSTLSIVDDADVRVATVNATGRINVSDSTDSSSSTTGSITTSGGVGIARSLRVSTGIYGTIQTSSQPNITSIGTLTSLSVSGVLSASTLSGTLQSAAQPNVTSLGTLTSLSIESISASMLTLTNTSASSISNMKFNSDSYSAEIGVRGTATSVNPSMMYFYYNGAYRILVNTSGDIAIGTNSFGYKLNINGSFNASSLSVGGVAISTDLISGSIATGTATANKALTADSNCNVANINSLTATNLNGTIQTAAQPNITSLGALTSLTVGSSTVGSTDIGYLSSSIAGTASASKVVVLDSNKDISGIRYLGLTNTNANSYAAQTLSSDSYTLTIGVRGSTNSTNPNLAYLHFNNDYRLLINSSGDVSIGTSAFGYKLNVGGSINATSYYLNGSTLDIASLTLLSGATAGVATASKALVLDASCNISGINSLGSTTITINGTTLSGTQAAYMTGITPGAATASKALVLDSSCNISGINNLSVSNLIVNGVSVSTIGSSDYISNITPGSADSSKAIVLDSNKNVTGINSMSMSTLVLGSASLTSTEANYLTGTTVGTAANSLLSINTPSASVEMASSVLSRFMVYSIARTMAVTV